ncbi:MAG: response regulator [Planctomycetota bacterium]
MTRVLFVEDDPASLDLLNRAMQQFHSHWTMEFFDDPEEALHALLLEPFDVVVSDMEMPGMDGAELLARVRELTPSSVRIVLGDLAEQERILRAVTSAHQFLAKPCSAVQLREAVTSACRLAERLNSEEVKGLVTRMDSLPSLPDIYLELVALLRDEEASIQDVGELIAEDVGMTAKVLQLVNSSFFGLPVHVSDARHAAALLGMKLLKPLVLTASIFRQMEHSRVPVRVLDEILEHSVLVGGVAKQIAQSVGLSRDAADNAFLSGVLHDIGKLVMLDNFGGDYSDLLRECRAEPSQLPSLETERFGASHAAVGGYLFGLWGLPHEIVEAVAYHHDPRVDCRDNFNSLTAVHLADAFCFSQEHADDEHALERALDEVYLQRLGLSADELGEFEALAAATLQEV